MTTKPLMLRDRMIGMLLSVLTGIGMLYVALHFTNQLISTICALLISMAAFLYITAHQVIAEDPKYEEHK